MPDRMRWIVPLLVVLALLSWVATDVLIATSRRWFEHDVEARARLALSGAHRDLARAWRQGDTGSIAWLLGEISRDERIMAAAACAPDLSLVAATSDYPAAFGCELLGSHVRPTAKSGAADWKTWTQVTMLGKGSVNVCAQPMIDGGEPLGFVVLVHDLSFIDRRGARTRLLAFAGLAALVLSASLITLLVGRAVWRRWTREMRLALRGEAARPEFQPILQEIRQLIAGFNSEHGTTPPWTAERLKHTLHRHLHGEKVVIVANREPYIHERDGSGSPRVRPSGQRPGDRARAGDARLLAASGSRTAAAPPIARPPTRTAASGFRPARRPTRSAASGSRRKKSRATTTASPTRGCGRCATSRTRGRSSAATTGRTISASTGGSPTPSAPKPARDDPIILVQDYHFALVPRMIRERLPRATILTLLAHPLAERRALRHLSLAREAPATACSAPASSASTRSSTATTSSRPSSASSRRASTASSSASSLDGHTTLVRPYPISIEWPNRWVEAAPPADECRQAVIAELGLRADALLGVGVDRLDYTKGIEERLLAVERLLERHPASARTLHLRPAGRAEPHRDRALPRAQRGRRGAGGAHQRALRRAATIGPS